MTGTRAQQLAKTKGRTFDAPALDDEAMKIRSSKVLALGGIGLYKAK